MWSRLRRKGVCSCARALRDPARSELRRPVSADCISMLHRYDHLPTLREMTSQELQTMREQTEMKHGHFTKVSADVSRMQIVPRPRQQKQMNMELCVLPNFVD